MREKQEKLKYVSITLLVLTISWKTEKLRLIRPTELYQVMSDDTASKAQHPEKSNFEQLRQRETEPKSTKGTRKLISRIDKVANQVSVLKHELPKKSVLELLKEGLDVIGWNGKNQPFFEPWKCQIREEIE